MPKQAAHGRFVWHDLVTSDLDAAKSFYTRLTPWKTEAWDDSDYTMWSNDGRAMGGLVSLTEELHSRGVAPHWLPYVSLYDLDACVRAVPSLGGRVLMAPKEVPNVGCWAVIGDPEGAAIGVYEPANVPPPPPSGARPGDFSWHELMTTRFDAVWPFYQSLFRWDDMGEQPGSQVGPYHLFGQGGQHYGGVFNRRPDMPPAAWWSYIEVEDATAAAGQVGSLGGKVMKGPMTVPAGGTIAICADPQGAAFAVHGPRASGTANRGQTLTNRGLGTDTA